MATIRYQHDDGRTDEVQVDDGVSVMRAALSNGVSGIVGECGGQAMCATCHVYVSDQQGLPALSDDEDEMLDCAADERTEQSRLGCQLVGGEHFADLTVRVPAVQV